MSGEVRVLRKAILIIAVSLVAAAPALAGGAQVWTLVPKESAVAFQNPSITPDPIPIPDFITDISFDPSNLQGSKFNIAARGWGFFLSAKEINLEVLKTAGNGGIVPPEEPSAAFFTSKNIRRVEKNSFVAEGDMKFYNKIRPLSIPFTVAIVEGAGTNVKVVFKGSFVVKRSDYSSENYSNLGPNEIPIAFQFSEKTH